MVNHSSISSFIAHARGKGMDHQTIRMVLLSTGWKEKDIAEALAAETLTMPIPLPPDAGSARDAFFHLLGFTSLITLITSLGVLFFRFWDYLLPDAAFPVYTYSADAVASSLRWPLASVFVSFPLFVYLSRVLRKEYVAHPEKLGSGVRRWLTYLTLFVAACTLIGDAVALIAVFLEGELTLRFLLKVLTIVILAGVPFTYYIRTMRLDSESYAKSTLHTQFLIIGGVLVLIATAWSFALMGSPARSRDLRMDEQRLGHLRAIAAEIQNIVLESAYYAPDNKPVLRRELPKTLEEAQESALYQKLSITDPETGVPYEYRVLGRSTFELCAQFTYPRDLDHDISWNHDAGRDCFTRDVLDANVR